MGPPFAYYDKRYDFTFIETVSYCVIGGTLGVLLFTFFSKSLLKAWYYFKIRIKKAIKSKSLFSDPVADVDTSLEIHYEYISNNEKNRSLFTPKNRKVVNIWRKYGLFGIAFLTPVILSIPVGTIIANSLEKNKKKVIIYMFFSLVFWSITMTSLFELFHAVSIRELKEQLTK